MNDANHGKSGAATGPSPDEEALRMPLGTRGKKRPLAEKGRKKDHARSKPDNLSAPLSSPTPPPPAAEVRRGGASRFPIQPSSQSKSPKSPGKASNSSPSS